jgi:alpha-tubulin suppressor-like RCC1 family protein
MSSITHRWCALCTAPHARLRQMVGFGLGGVPTPALVTMPLSGTVIALTAADQGESACAIINHSGSQYAACWGNNDTGQLGTADTTNYGTPQLIPFECPGGGDCSDSATQISMGTSHACGVAAGGRVYCWGDNTYGDVGDGTTTQRLVPTLVYGLAAATGWSVSAGGEHTSIALHATLHYSVSSWGRTTFINSTTTSGSTTSPISRISAGYSRTCASYNGTPYCWGQAALGQLGNSQSGAVPASVDGGITW